MKPIDLDATTTARIPDFGTSPIRVARRPRTGSAAAAEAPALAKPPALVIVTEAAPRSARIKAGTRLLLPVVIAAFTWVLLGSTTTGRPSRSHQAAARLTPVQQRVAAAARLRAAAIAQARRDRGTDAELQDTIPALTPAPVRASAG